MGIEILDCPGCSALNHIAKELFNCFKKHYLPEAVTKDPVMLENKKWAALHVKDKLLAVVLEGYSRELTEKLLETALKR